MSKKYALISVSDKTNIVPFAQAILKAGYDIISTGGTAKTLHEAKLKYTPIQEITGNPESFDGRMKTISFQIESALLYDRNNPKHVAEAKKLKIPQIDIVVCNLFPFEYTVADKKVNFAKAIENIDVGGPTMIRAAAKKWTRSLSLIPKITIRFQNPLPPQSSQPPYPISSIQGI